MTRGLRLHAQRGKKLQHTTPQNKKKNEPHPPQRCLESSSLGGEEVFKRRGGGTECPPWTLECTLDDHLQEEYHLKKGGTLGKRES